MTTYKIEQTAGGYIFLVDNNQVAEVPPNENKYQVISDIQEYFKKEKINSGIIELVEINPPKKSELDIRTFVYFKEWSKPK